MVTKEMLKPCEGVTFYPLTHEYATSDGRFLKGITTLLKEQGLSADYTGIPEARLRKAAEKGTAMHELIEAYEAGKPVPDTPELQAYKKMIAETGLVSLCSEYLVSDGGKTVASSIDMVYCLPDDNEGVVLGDFKHTSTFHRKPTEWQLSIYKVLFERQNPGLQVRAILGFHIPGAKGKVYELSPHPESEVDRLLMCNATGLDFTPDEKALPSLLEEKVSMLVDVQSRLEALTNTIAPLQEAKDEILKALFAAMKPGENIEAGGYRFTRVEPATKDCVDSKKLKEKYNAIYKECIKTSEVSGYVKVTQLKS